jgi:hypothetical protein
VPSDSKMIRLFAMDTPVRLELGQSVRGVAWNL